MALIVSLTLPATNMIKDEVLVEVPEETYPKAYARLLSVRATSSDAYLLVCWYADEAARFSGIDPIKAQEFIFPTESMNGAIYPAAYAYLKTLPNFEGAVDHPITDPSEA